MMGDLVAPTMPARRPVIGVDAFAVDLRGVFAGVHWATRHPDGSPGYRLAPTSEAHRTAYVETLADRARRTR